MYYQDPTPKQLWENLNKLVNANDAFFKSEHVIDDTFKFVIFNYRLASYTDFLEESALECRGTMFEVTSGGNYIRLASRPPHKFFNLNENPMTMDLDPNRIVEINDKADGSLISTYHIDGKLFLKSKGSLSSEQALDAMDYLKRPENAELAFELSLWTSRGFTVNMEWVGPHNRIVLPYDAAELVILNIRNNETGEYIHKASDLVQQTTHIKDRWIETYSLDELQCANYNDFITASYDMTGREGFVLRMHDGQHVKIKNTWYCALHHAKDSVNSPRRLFTAVLEEATDDLRTMFHDDPQAIQIIEDMELYVESIYNPMVANIERYFEENKDKERKDYAIEGQRVFDNKGEFGLAMSLYSGKPVDYKAYLIKNYKNYGIKEDDNESV